MRPIREEGNGMVQAENFDSRCSSFELDDRSRRDHHNLAHLSKLPLSETGTPTPRTHDPSVAMSALPPKADMDQHGCDVCFVPKADIGTAERVSFNHR